MKKTHLITLAVVVLIAGAYTLFKIKSNLSSQPANTGITVIYTNNGFDPNNISLNKETVVTFENKSSHPFQPVGNQGQSSPCVDGVQFGACAPIPPGGTWSASFEFGGVWIYSDALKPSSTMTFTITSLPELSSSTTRYPIDRLGL